MSRTHAPSGWMYRTHDPEDLHEELWGWVRGEGMTGWDIGANEGQSVDKMTELGFGSIIALEPAIESFRILEREWGSRDGLLLLNKAAGAASGTVKLSVRSTPMGGGQLVSPDLPGEGWHGPEMYQREVECTTLDAMQDAYGTPDFIKVDTEGFEEQILRGGAGVIHSCPDWLIEYHSPELRNACRELLGSHYIIRDIPNGEGADNGWLMAEGC